MYVGGYVGFCRVAETVKFILREGGQTGSLRPLFQGITPTLLGIVPYSGMTWLTYGTLRDYTYLLPGGSEATSNKVRK